MIGGPLYGLHNIGDEAILDSLLQSLYGVTNISVFTYGSEWIDKKYSHVRRIPIDLYFSKPKFGLSACPRKKIWKSIRNTYFPNLTSFQHRKLFVCGGATILSDCPWHALHLVELAWKSGVPSVLWGVGMTNISDSDTAQYIKRICNSEMITHIYTRDMYVQERLTELGVSPDKISVCYDPAYMLEPEDISQTDSITQNQKVLLADKSKVKICVSLSGESDVKNQSHIEAVKNFIKYVTEELDITVFLVPTGCGRHCKDREYLKSLVQNDRCVFIEKELSPECLIDFLSKMDVIISSRLHCAILGAITSVPTISLIRNDKQIDFARQFNLPALNMDGLSCDQLIESYREIMSDHELIEKRICKEVSLIRENYDNEMKNLKKLIM